MNRLSICYLPAQWLAFDPGHLRDSVCVVVDVIRATSTIVTALAHGAHGIRPVASVTEAEQLKARHPGLLLAGERQGRALPGFDLGNSPRSMTPEVVADRELILTTTNGTQALAACLNARAIIVSSLLNLSATADKLRELGPPWIVVCAGFEGDFGMDDAIMAGALADALDERSSFTSLYRSVRSDMAATLLGSQAGRELAKIGLQDDVPFCAECDRFPLVPLLDRDGVLRVGSSLI